MGEGIAEERIGVENCARHRFWKPLYATAKELEKKYSYTAAKTMAKLCENDSQMLQIR